jgi:hypothetical protein
MTKRQANKVLTKLVCDHHDYRCTTIQRMLNRNERLKRLANKEKQKRINALSPEQRRHFSMIRIPLV